MKQFLILITALVFFSSCKQSVNRADLSKINGYWEIEKAIMPDGSKKEYKINTTIDFFKIQNDTGFRKKVMPQLDGKYLINDLSENIKITEKEGIFYLNYTTTYATWKEEIISLNAEKLVIRNEHDIEYFYKRPKPFSLK